MNPIPSLEDELQFLKISVERSSDEVFWLDFEGNILYANDAASRITGYSRQELCAMKIFELDPEMPPGAWEASVADLREKKTQFITSRHRCKDGTIIDVDILAVYVNHGEREFSFAYVRDITERKRAEALLRETDRKYRLLADHVHDVIWTTDRDMHFTYVSPSVTALRGLTPEEAMGETFREALIPESYRVLMESREQGLAEWKKGGSVPRNIVLELEFWRKDGTTVWTDVAITPVFDKNRIPAGAVGIIRDISLRRQMEQSLRESQEKLRAVMDNLPDLVLVHRNGIIQYVNPSMIDNMGIAPENVLNTSILDYIPARYHARIASAVRERTENGRHEPYEIEIESPVKGHRVVLIRGSNIEFDGTPAVLTVLTDVTDQKQAEDALRESEEKFRSYVENANDIVFSLTPEGITSYVSPNWTEVLGHDTAEIIGRPVRHIHPDDLPRVQEFIRQTVANKKKAGGIEYRIQHKDGTWQWHTQNISPVYDAGGRVIAIHGICHDVTERKKAEEALRKSEEKFRSYVENAHDIIYTLTDEGIFTYVSPRWTELLGHDAREVVGKSFSVFIHPDDHQACREFIRQVLSTGEKKGGIEYRIQHKDGTWRWHTTTASPLCDDAGSITSYLGICRDITDRKRTEEALRKSGQQLADAMDIASLVNWEYDAATNLFTFNDRFYALYGTTAEREGGLQMSPDTYAREFIHPDDRHLMFMELENILKTTDSRYLAHLEHRIIRRDGEVRQISVHIRVTLDAEGRLVRTHGANQDITERKQAEKALGRANRQLTLLNGITRHDILNKVSIILGFLAVAENKESDPEICRYLEKIESATAAIQSQIEFTRMYENLGTHEPQWIDLDTVMPRQYIPPPITLNSDVKGVQVFSDPMLEKVFFNLLDNSIRHGQRVSEIRISARLSDGNLVVVWEDNGVGIAADEKERVFERGYGKNTGLGMFLVREILTLTGITISETGEPGRGARFEILVPKGAFRVHDA
nr:PAS domain S-box protein [uncultured Methanoregula sp.]